jgi:hypothetical protein
MNRFAKYSLFFIGVCAVFLLWGCTTTVDGTAGSIYDACTGWRSTGEATMLYCESYFDAALQKVKDYNYMNNNRFFNPVGYQIDSEFGRALFINYLKKHPEQKKLPVGRVYLNAMGDYFKNN